nr:translocation/assembly module TamB [Pseudomonadota bacterium]
MSEVAADGAGRPALPRRRGRWLSLAAKAALSMVAAAMLFLGAMALLLDTDLGHRLILDRIAAMTPQSGLRIRIGRLEGSIWGRTELRDVRLYDPEGLFAEAPKVDLEWQPLAWLFGRLTVHEVETELAMLHRMPRLLERDDAGPALPDYDVHVGRLTIAQLRIGEEVSGERRTARIVGGLELRSGRALVDLDASFRDGGDRLALLLDAAPERDQFDLEVALDAPPGGVIGRMLGTDHPVRLAVSGDGSWRQWDGTARLDLAGRRAGDLRLSAASGNYGARGWLAPAPLL